MTTIVFDFDGTLADTHKLLLEIYNQLAKSRGLHPVNEQDWQRLRGGNIKTGIKWLGIRSYQVPGLLKGGLKLLEQRKGEIQLYPGMVEVVKTLSKNGHQLFILTTNSQTLVQEVLAEHGIGQEIEVLKSSRLFGKAKALRELLRGHKLSKQSVWMIGDEVRDMEAATKAGVRPLGVSWGFQPAETLKAVDSRVQIAKTPADVLQLVQL